MKLQTTISETAIRMRFADHDDPAKAVEWIDLQVPLKGLRMPKEGSPELGNPEYQHLADTYLAALAHVQSEVGKEIQRLRAGRGRTET